MSDLDAEQLQVESIVAASRERAKALVERRSPDSLAAAANAGYLIAEGDSWFAYPLFLDIVEALEADHGFRVRSAAHHGDTVESMAYEDQQLDRVRRIFSELAEDGKTPRAILVSAGGNDIQAVFEVLLNHRASRLPVLNEDVVRGLLDVRVQAALLSLITALLVFADEYFPQQDLRVVVHGYGRPVPDGRGYPLLGLSGPWFKPGFAAKGYVSADPQSDAELQDNAAVLGQLIDRFNAIAAALPARPEFGGRVRYVDLRSVFSNVVAGGAYRDDWRDELHATRRASSDAADLIAQAI